MRYIIKIMLLLLLVFPVTSSARTWGFSVGQFYFQATDYYYPNFYDDMGYRGELNLILESANPKIYFPLQAQIYGYPGDDNIFEYAPEVGIGFRFGGDSSVTGYAVPILGFGRVKKQYPAPYYPTITHTYLNFVRLGYDGGVAYHPGKFSVGWNTGFRYLYNLADNFYPRHTTVAEVNAELGYQLLDNLRLTFKGGIETGGYYEKIYFGRGNFRPYFEFGFVKD